MDLHSLSGSNSHNDYLWVGHCTGALTTIRNQVCLSATSLLLLLLEFALSCFHLKNNA
jgi:hypothetical protein